MAKAVAVPCPFCDEIIHLFSSVREIGAPEAWEVYRYRERLHLQAHVTEIVDWAEGLPPPAIAAG